MAGIVNRPNGHRWLQWRDGKRTVRVRLGQVSRPQAESMLRLVEEILTCQRLGERIDQGTLRRFQKLDEKLQRQFANAGLIRHSRNPTLNEFLTEFVASAVGAPNTIRNHEQFARQLLEFFGGEIRLRDIRPSDADRWRKSRANMAASTVNRETKRAKQFFAAAVRDQWIVDNPFAHLKAGKMSNPARSHFINRETSDRIFEVLPNVQWRLVVALARYGALRVPSDLLAVRWSGVDWDRSRFSFYAPKDKRVRTVPMFPELRTAFDQAIQAARDGDDRLVTECRNTGNLRAGLKRALMRAAVQPWPRLWHNLRATRITELCDRFPQHVVSEWVGNTEQVAKEHYLQLTEAHYAAAIASDASDSKSDQKRMLSVAQTRTNSRSPVQNCASLRNGEQV